MPTQITRDELVDTALRSLIAVMREHADGPVREPGTLRVVLAFLATGDREPFDTFWREAARDRADNDASRFGRFQAMRAAYAAIARRHGRDYW